MYKISEVNKLDKTLQEIRAAEKKSEEIIVNAHKKAESVIRGAKSEAQKLLEKRKSDFEDNREKHFSEKNKQIQEEKAKILKQAENDAESMEIKAKKKQKQAVEKVLKAFNASVQRDYTNKVICVNKNVKIRTDVKITDCCSKSKPKKHY